MTDPAWSGLAERDVEAFVNALERSVVAEPTDVPPSGAKGWGDPSVNTSDAPAYLPPSNLKGWGPTGGLIYNSPLSADAASEGAETPGTRLPPSGPKGWGVPGGIVYNRPLSPEEDPS
jgi:hypothetical protein